jgi:hypothetical protein
MPEARNSPLKPSGGKTTPRHPEQVDKDRQYVGHRLKNGANLEEVLREEYVLRNSTQTEREQMIRDPELIQRSREGLKQYFESDELKPKHPTKASLARDTRVTRRVEPLTEVDGGKIGPPSTGG